MIDWKQLPSLLRRSAGTRRGGAAREMAPASYGRLALRLERDLGLEERGRSVLVAAVDDDAVGVEAVTELAWHLAEEQGHRVLMVDSTFGRGALSVALGMSDAPGLANLMGGPDVDTSGIRAAARPTQHENIFMLPRGFGDNGRLIPARSESIRQLLEAACRAYDFVLVLGSVLDRSSRSVTFGGFVDAALLVAVEGRSLVHDIQRGQGILNEAGATRVGLVLASHSSAGAAGSA